ncbi:MAG: site-specific integrase [Pseudomonadota bacterium]|nr:site-specific integrase [Pseudomonadota bacterium]
MATISKRKASWFVQIRRKGFAPRYRSFESHAAAARWAREQESIIDQGLGRGNDREVARISIKQLLERYSLEISSKKKGVETEQLRIKKMQDAPFAELRATDLTPAVIASYRDARLEIVKPSTVRRELGILRSALEVARREWAIPLSHNPVKMIALPAANDARERRLSADELKRLSAAIGKGRNPHLQPLLTIALETAMRRGELLKLTWPDIDLVARKAVIRDTKTGTDRTIPLSKIAAATLSALPCKLGRVFPITANALRQSWARACKRSNVDNLRFHDLRHEAVSRLFELGLSVPEVALISGHKDPRMLFRYTHLMPDQVRDRLDALER